MDTLTTQGDYWQKAFLYLSRKIVRGLVDLDHGGVCAPQRRSPPPVYTILAPTKTSSLFTQLEGLRTMPSISCKLLAPLPPAELLARQTVAPSLDADTHSIKWMEVALPTDCLLSPLLEVMQGDCGPFREVGVSLSAFSFGYLKLLIFLWSVWAQWGSH